MQQLNKMQNEVIKILIIRFSSIGDIVLTTPVIRCLKQQVHDSYIYYLTKKKYSEILINNPYIDKLYLYDDDLAEIIDSLKKEDILYSIDLHHNIRSSIVKSRLHSISFSFNKINIQKWLLVNLKINRLPRIHIVDRYLKTINLFAVNNDNKGLDYFISEADEINLNTLPSRFQKGYVTFVIGALHETKKLPLQKTISICKKIDYPIILLGGEDDKINGEYIASQSGLHVINGCGDYRLNQSASLIRQSKVVISHDTGLMHIAAAFKKPVLSVWGNTIPEFGMYPYFPGEGSEIFEVKGLSCRPCSKLGKKNCPKGHFRCMMEINENAIAAKVNNILRIPFN